MRKFQRVRIYREPVKEKIPEAEVSLLKHLSNHGYHNERRLERWKVIYDDGRIANRIILSQEEKYE